MTRGVFPAAWLQNLPPSDIQLSLFRSLEHGGPIPKDRASAARLLALLRLKIGSNDVQDLQSRGGAGA